MGQDIDINYTLVAYLIDANSATWKLDVLNKLFGSEQVNRTVSILLFLFARTDELVWQGDNAGVYLAMSGYKWLMAQNSNTTANDATNQNTMLKVFYKKLWSLDVANKIKFTCWNITNNYFPTLGNLQARRIVAVSYCPVCRMAKDLVEHMFKEWPITNQILQELEMSFSSSNRTNNWKLWLAQEFVNNSLGKCKMWGIIFWVVWHNRNIIYHERAHQNAFGVIAFVKAYVQKLENLNRVMSTIQQSVIFRWEPPIGDIINVNFDAIFH